MPRRGPWQLVRSINQAGVTRPRTAEHSPATWVGVADKIIAVEAPKLSVQLPNVSRNVYCVHRLESAVMPQWIHHGIVWTEKVLLAASAADRPVLAELAQRAPVWGPNVAQIVLAPSVREATPPTVTAYFPANRQPLILGPATPFDRLRTRDFFRYCADTLGRGVKRLHDELGNAVFRGPLGVIAPQSDRATRIIDELEKEKPEVRWSELARGDGRCHYGPHLLQLAAHHLAATEGIDPLRALCVVRLAPDRSVNLDYLLATSALGLDQQPLGRMNGLEHWR